MITRNQEAPITHNHRFTVAIFVIAIALRILVLCIVAAYPSRALSAGDSGQYLRTAQNIVEQNTFSANRTEPYAPDIHHTPGYPALLAVLYILAGHQHSIFLITFVQAILSILNIYLVLRIGYKLTSSTVAQIAALIYAVAPISLSLVGLVMSETWFSTLLLAGILLTLKISPDRKSWRYALGAGILFALSVYVRPIGLYFIPIPMLAAIIQLKRTRRALLYSGILGLTFIATLAPWYYRNYVHYQSIIFTSLANDNLLNYNITSIEAHRQKISWNKARQQIWTETGVRMEAAGLTSPNDAQTSQFLGQLALEHILAHPVDAFLYQSVDILNSFRPGYSLITLLLRNNPENFGDETSGDSIGTLLTSPFPLNAIYILLTAYYALLYILLLVGYISSLQNRAWLLLIVSGLIPLWFMYLPGGAGNARFRAPVEGLLSLAAAAGIVWIWNRVKRPVVAQAGAQEISA
jgi:4-amino-4-deoxy-L-arabinose transferase-like glycosyltransferase